MRRNWREDNEPYIMNGRVIRNNGRSSNDYSYYNNNYNSNSSTLSQPSIWRYASWKRIGILTVVSAILFVTNPANNNNNNIMNDIFNINNSNKSRRRNTAATTTTMMMPPYTNKAILTNYGLFALQEEKLSTGIRLHALTNSWSICNYYDSSEPFIGDICWMIGSNMIHGKPLIWDNNRIDRVHTTHRILCGILILSSVIVFCFPNLPPSYILFPSSSSKSPQGILKNLLYGLLSVFYTTPSRIFFDLMNVNLCVYPAIQRISRIVPELSSQKKSFFLGPTSNVDSNFEFILWMLVLIVGIGGGCNIITTRLTGKRCCGITTIIAASLTYVQRTTVLGTPILFYFRGDQPITAVNGYWTMLLMSILFHHQHNDQWLPYVVSWLLAGFMGSMMAKYHLENIFLLGGVLKFFGMT